MLFNDLIFELLDEAVKFGSVGHRIEAVQVLDGLDLVVQKGVKDKWRADDAVEEEMLDKVEAKIYLDLLSPVAKRTQVGLHDILAQT